MEEESVAEGGVLGVDYGTVRIGVAFGDLGSGLVLPLPTVANPGEVKEAAARVAEVVVGRGPKEVVIGEPWHKSGASNPMVELVREFGRALEPLVEVPLVFMDERYTSAAAESTLAAAGLKWWQYDKGHVDAMAAMNLVRDRLRALRPELGLEAETEQSEPEWVDPVAEKRRQRRAMQRKKRR